MTIALIIIASFVGAWIFGSFFEWSLHRYLMHGVLIKAYPYHTHDRVHHQVFGPGPTYHLSPNNEHPDLVTMAWWNGPLILLANAPLPLLVTWIVGSWWVMAGAMPAYLMYYAMYEYLHWCMHVPGPRWFQKLGLFKWLDQHHRLHHLDSNKNLNVVFPLADWILRSRMARAPVVVPDPPAEVPEPTGSGR
jgi:hypothetical protein